MDLISEITIRETTNNQDNSSDNIELLSSQIITTFKNKEVNTTNWMLLVINIIQSIEEISDITGIEKKELAIEVIVKSFPKLNIQNQDIVEGLLSRDSLSNTIDLMISTSKGQIDINKIKKTIKLCIFGCMKNKKLIDETDFSQYNFYQNTLNSFKNKEINISNWMMIITKVIQDVERIKHLNGPEKKDLAIQMTIKIYKELEINNDMLGSLFTHSVLTSVINTVISVSKNQIKLNNNIDARKIKKLK